MADWKWTNCWQALQDNKKDGKSGKIMDDATFKIHRVIIKTDPVSIKSDPVSIKSDLAFVRCWVTFNTNWVTFNTNRVTLNTKRVTPKSNQVTLNAKLVTLNTNRVSLNNDSVNIEYCIIHNLTWLIILLKVLQNLSAIVFRSVSKFLCTVFRAPISSERCWKQLILELLIYHN